MDEYWQIILTAFGGAIVGGIFSIVATIITFKSERKKQKETDERHFEQDMSKQTIEEKKAIYIELVQIITKLTNITIEIEPDMNEYGDKEIGNIHIKETVEVMNEVSDFCYKNRAIIQLYFSPIIKNEIFNLRRLVCKISMKEKINKEEFVVILSEFTKQSEIITSLIRQDLKIKVNNNLSIPKIKLYLNSNENKGD